MNSAHYHKIIVLKWINCRSSSAEDTEGQLQKGKQEEENVHVIEKPSQLRFEQDSIINVWRDVEDGGHQEGWDDDAQVFDKQPSESSCATQPFVEQSSILDAWREDTVEEQPQEGRGEEDSVQTYWGAAFTASCEGM
ncbi:hypothetical protein ACLB2K_073867 [Fragaria x ananassa]